MKCFSCSGDIPPQWIWAYQNNICPSCGSPLMDDVSKELLTGLTEAMKQMENNPSGLAGWLLSNYHMEKIGSGEPTEFHTATTKFKRKRAQEQVSDDGEPKALTGADILKRNGQAKLLENTTTAKDKTKEILARVRKAQQQDLPEDDFDEDIIEDDSPVVDNEFAKVHGDFEDVDDLPAKINQSDPRVIQQKRLQRLMNQEALASGEKVGVIRRSG